MKHTPHWARVARRGAATLRRGAWYPVVEGSLPRRVVIEAGDREVALHTDLVELRQDRPSSFSVVERDPVDRNPAAGTAADLGLTYAVCPASRTRVRLTGYPDYLECPDCGYRGFVDWDHPC